MENVEIIYYILTYDSEMHSDDILVFIILIPYYRK